MNSNACKYTEKPCRRHQPYSVNPLKWVYWAYHQEKQGHTQSQCPVCGRWYYPSEF
jgi:uncharacterized OB-fold protein